MTKTYVVTAKQIESAATEMTKCLPGRYENYIKKNGEWVLDNILIPNTAARMSTRFYIDGREKEIIKWAQ